MATVRNKWLVIGLTLLALPLCYYATKHIYGPVDHSYHGVLDIWAKLGVWLLKSVVAFISTLPAMLYSGSGKSSAGGTRHRPRYH